MCSSSTKEQRMPGLFCECTIYKNKLAIIGGEDPYELGILSSDEKLMPAIKYPDIVNYLLFTPRPYTSDDMKSYKGLQAYNQMCFGWVRDCQARKFGDKCLVKCNVCIMYHLYASYVDLLI